MTRVTSRRIDAAIDTLVDLASEERLGGTTRDEISHVIQVLEEIRAAKRQGH